MKINKYGMLRRFLWHFEDTIIKIKWINEYNFTTSSAGFNSLRTLPFSSDVFHVNIFCYEEFEDTKGIIRIRKSKKDRQHNGQKKNDNRKTKIYENYI
jgi:hypothetical protein